jgi:hypothetical protein
MTKGLFFKELLPVLEPVAQSGSHYYAEDVDGEHYQH